MSRLPTEVPEELNHLSYVVIGAAIAVHQALGPGLNEGAYESALAVELAHRGIAFEPQVPAGLAYRGVVVGRGRIDLVVAERLAVELKSVVKITPTHVSQVLGHLRALHEPPGLVPDFNVARMKDGIRRVVRWAGL